MPVATVSRYVSTGLYSTSQAARLIGTDRRRVKRWAFGYRQGDYPSAISTELDKLGGNYALTFVEMIELLSIREALDAGLSWQKLREALPVVRQLLEAEHPLATKRWFADPASLFVELIRDDEPEVLVDLVAGGQIAMLPPLERYLTELEFGPDEVANRWKPAGEDAPILIDPTVAFGQPVVEGTGVRTAVLYRMHLGGDDVETIAWAYELDPGEVEAALEYEASLAA